MSKRIRAHIEVKLGDQWLHYAAPEVETNLELFDLLDVAGREHEFPMTTLSQVTAMSLQSDKDRIGAMGLGVVMADQLYDLQAELYRRFPRVKKTGIDELDFENSIFRTYINDNALCRHDGWDDLRIVFWFSN